MLKVTIYMRFISRRVALARLEIAIIKNLRLSAKIINSFPSLSHSFIKVAINIKPFLCRWFSDVQWYHRLAPTTIISEMAVLYSVSARSCRKALAKFNEKFRQQFSWERGTGQTTCCQWFLTKMLRARFSAVRSVYSNSLIAWETSIETRESKTFCVRKFAIVFVTTPN